MRKMRKYTPHSFKEEEITVLGRDTLEFPDGDMSSIPSEEGWFLVFSNGSGEDLYVHQTRGGSIVSPEEGKFDSIQDLVDFLNAQNYKYIGVDDL